MEPESYHDQSDPIEPGRVRVIIDLVTRSIRVVEYAPDGAERVLLRDSDFDEVVTIS